MLLLLLLIAGGDALLASDCQAGQEFDAAGNNNAGTCPACAPGTFNILATAEAGTACGAYQVTQATCAIGQEAIGGDLTQDNTCTNCATGFNPTANGGACGAYQVTQATCAIGQEAIGGDNTQDNTCTNCATGFNPTANGGACGAYQVTQATCAIGQEAIGGDHTQDNTCTNCSAGNFNDQTGAGTCGPKTAMSTCTAGTAYNAGLAATVDSDDASCVACANAGDWNTAARAQNGDPCIARTVVTPCAGATKEQVGDASTDNVCVAYAEEADCAAGQDLRDGANYVTTGTATTACTDCATGTFKADNGAATAAECGAKVAATQAGCSAGQEFFAGTSKTSDDSACNDCGASEFNAVAGSGTCAAHTNAIAGTPAGSKFVAGTATADSGFVACAVGQYSAQGAGTCSDKTVTGACTLGQEFKAGDDNVVDQDDASCDPCNSSNYNTAAGDACVAWTAAAGSCGKGQDAQGGSSSTDNTCQDCAVGTFAAAAGGSCVAKAKASQGDCQAFEKPVPGTKLDADDSDCANRAKADCADGKLFVVSGAGGTCDTCTVDHHCKGGDATANTVFQVNDVNTAATYCDPNTKKIVGATSSADAKCVVWETVESCKAGTRLEDASGAKTTTVNAASTCNACAQGKFKAADGAGDCVVHTVTACSDAKKVFTAGDATKDGSCDDPVVAPASSAAGVSLISIMIATFFAAAW